MDAQVFFHADDVLVTPAVARFGPVSYQVSAISSVAVHHRPRLNPIAVSLVVLALVLGLAAYAGRSHYPDYALWAALAAPAALIAGIAWQRLRPVLEYRFVMRTAGSETETLTTFDQNRAFALKEAIEQAFIMQLPRSQQAFAAEPLPQQDEPRADSDDLLITRDWLVANPELAPR